MNYKYKRTKENGITLIALVISVIILIIISTIALDSLIGDNRIIDQAATSVNELEIPSIKEILNTQIVELPENEIGFVRYMNTDEVNKVMNGNNRIYKDKIGIYRQDLIYLGDEESEEAIYMESKGFKIINMTPDEFKYYIELGMLEDAVKEEKNKYIGRELGSKEFDHDISIGDNTYGFGWYLIGNYTDEEKKNNTYQEQFDALNLKDTTHAPYIVNYDTGVVLSIDGMVMYQAQILVHSFNDEYDDNLKSAITYVNSFTNKTGESYGPLISTSKYTGSVDNYGGGMSIYKDNNGELQYDGDGALLLDENNAIPVLEIDKKFNLEDNFSINVTLEGDYMQKPSRDSYPNTIVALSEGNTKYLLWIGVYNGYLQIYAFYGGAALANINYENTRVGFSSIDISKYSGQKINLQVIAACGKDVNVYINGEKIKTFKAGSTKLTFQYITLGDLRVGRNLKFVGKIFEFGLYGATLDEESIQNNWERAKRYVEN